MPVTIPGAIADDTSTTAVITAGTVDTYASTLSYSNDSDWWRIEMVAGLTYDFTLTGDGSATSLDNGDIIIRSATGTLLDSAGKNGTVTWTAATSGSYYIEVRDGYSSDNLAEGSYIITARTNDTVANTTATTAQITGTGDTAGALGQSEDSDWFRVDLTAGLTYDFRVTGDGSAASLDSASLVIRDASGTVVSTTGKNAWNSLTPAAGGTYYIEVKDGYLFDNAAEGNFILSSRMGDTVLNSQATTATITATGTRSGVLGQSNDSDWYAVSLKAGLSYAFTLTGDGSASSLDDGIIAIRNGANQVIDDAGEGGTAIITPAQTGTYWIEVRDGYSFDGLAEGNFRIRSILSDTVRDDVDTSGRLISADRVAGRIDGSGDSDWFKMAVVAGRSYTVTLTGDGSAGSIVNRYLAAHDQNGTRLVADYGYGAGDVATVTFKATASGAVFLAARGAGSSDTGSFRLAAVSDAGTVWGTSGHDFRAGGANANTILGQAGNDSLYGNAGNDLLIGDTGADLLSGGDGKDVLRGDSGADTLYGGAGVDRLKGGAGNDLLGGGGGADVFDFARGYDADRISDFTDNADTLVLSGLGVGTVAQALARAKQVGANVVFDFGSGDVLTVANTTKAALVDDLLIV